MMLLKIETDDGRCIEHL